MKKRVIKVELTEKSIDNAIKELLRYKTWLKECTEKFLKALGDEGMEIASARFQQAEYDGTNDVSVSVENRTAGIMNFLLLLFCAIIEDALQDGQEEGISSDLNM